jgi:hypothetical protein
MTTKQTTDIWYYRNYIKWINKVIRHYWHQRDKAKPKINPYAEHWLDKWKEERNNIKQLIKKLQDEQN